MSGEAGHPSLLGLWCQAMSYRRDGRTWPVGDAATAQWIRDGTTPGLTIDSAILLVFESYATLALPDDHACMDTCLVDVLAMHGPHPWWLGFLLTGTDDDDTTPDLPPVPLFVSWEYVLVEAGPSQAASRHRHTVRQRLVRAVAARVRHGHLRCRDGGTALSAFFTPRFVKWFGYGMTHVIIAVALLLTAALIWSAARNSPRWQTTTGPVRPKLMAAAKLTITWQMSFLYAVAFGGFFAFSTYLPT